MSNNRELGTVVGAVVGYFTGGASYVALGATIGGIAGGLLDPKVKNEGPRLNDLKVQTSEYGVGIPILYGTERISPNVIWSTDKIEIPFTSSVGKGGGGVENTTYQYLVHMRLLLCERPRDGSEVQILQIFADGKLRWDARSGIPIESALASAESPFAFFTLYQGGDDQLPDPVEEIYQGGPGTVPAYRGVVSISMKAIDCPAGRVPQFSFVLSTSSERTTTLDLGIESELTPAIQNPQRISATRVNTSTPTYIFEEGGVDLGGIAFQKTIRITPVTVSGKGVPYFMNGLDLAYSYTAVRGHADIDAICVREVPASTYVDSGNNLVLEVGSTGKSFFLDDILVYGQSTSAWSKFGDRIAFIGDQNAVSFDAALFDYETRAQIGRANGVGATDVYVTEQYVWLFVPDEDTNEVSVQLRSTEDFSLISTTVLDWAVTGVQALYSKTDVDTLGAWVSSAGGSDLYSLTVDGLGQVRTALVAHDDQGLLPSNSAYAIDIQGTTVVGATFPPIESGYAAQLFVLNLNALVTSGFRAKDVIADQMARCGEDRYDTTDIPDGDVLFGYKIGTPASARANIDPVLGAFQYFVVEEDGLVRFKRYADIETVGEVSFDELGASEDGADLTDPMPLTRAQELDLPRQVTVSYIEPTFDFQTASESESRQITSAVEEAAVSVPLAISSDRAKTTASQMLFASWRKQNTRTTRLTRKFAYVSPGDGLEIEYPRGTMRQWRVTSTNDTGALIELSLEPGDAELWQQEAEGETGYVGQQVSPLPPPTRQELLDIPILRDADNNAGIYAAFAPVVEGLWRGATLFMGDDELSFEERGSVTAAASIGVAQEVLGDWTTYAMDESNTVIVSASSDAFTSVTRDALIQNASLNAFAFGAPGRWEILQAASCEYLGDGVYRFSRFIRGLRGTEHNRGNHDVGDVVVLLTPSGMLRPGMDVGALNQERFFKAVSLGRSLSTSATLAYANTGEGLRPFSPVHLRGDYDDDDLVISWDRRTRLSTNWLSEIVPLGEASERWEIRLYLDSTHTTVMRVLLSTTSSVTYTAAQQSLDGYTPGNPLYVGVAQISDSVGRGHELLGVL